MSSPPSRFDLPEELGRYQLGSVLGVGGFAVVVQAHDEALAADVAIKILDRGRAADPEVRERFVREARLLRRVRSSAVVTVHDVGETSDGLPYFVMDLAPGGTLEDRLSRDPGPAPHAQIGAVVETLVTGLGALHSAGVIHRDVKPSNLLIAADGRLMLGDLGLAKDRDATAYGPTMIGGTPLYQAPEQTELGAAIDERTDVYGATAILWRLLTGAPPPLPAELEGQLIGAPDLWRSVIARGLALRPEERFASITEWGTAVRQVLDSGSSTVAAAATGVTCPYKGLAAFEAGDAALFFGRTQLVDELVARLQAHSTLVIGGPSGSGKSSLLRAGLLPALAQGGLPGSQNWPQQLLSPGPHPLEVLEDLAGPAVIAVDQFEEVFTACDDPAERAGFIDKLQALAQDHKIIVALRADFYGECAKYPWLASIINENHVLVGPMSRSQLRSAVEGPARRVGLRLEEGLTDRILDDTGEDVGTLPLLAHALVETWVRRKGATLTIAGYESAGGVAGALTRSADELWKRQSTEERRAIRRIFLRLVHPGDGTPDTKRTATWTELGEDEVTRRCVSALAEARLVAVDEHGVQLAHEAIIRTWGRLGSWLDDGRDQMRGRERVESAAREWDSQRRDPDLLLRGTPLTAALEWQQSLDDRDRASQTSEEFLAAARFAREAEEEAKEREFRRRAATRKRVLSVVSVLAAFALLTSVVAVVGFGRARSQANNANEQLVRNLAASSLEQSTADPYLATILALEALGRSDPPPAEAKQALVSARTSLGGDRPVPLGDPIPVGDAITVAISPDGSRAVTGHRDGSLVMWDIDRRVEVARTGGPKGGLQKVAFSPDGSWVAAGGDDGILWRWDLAPQPGKIKKLRELGSILWSVAVSPAGDRVAAATEGAEVWLLDAGTGEGAEPVGRNTGGFTSVAFSPDGQSLLAGDGAGMAYAWSTATGAPKFAPIQAHTSDIWELVVSPQNNGFVTVSSDGRARLWDLTTGARVQGAPHDTPAEVPEGVNGATFVDRDRLSTGGADGRIYTWSVTEHKVLDVTGTGHAGAITDAAASGKNGRLVSIGSDQTLRVWDRSLRPGAVSNHVLPGTVAYSIDIASSQVAVGTGDGAVAIVDPESGEERSRLGGISGRVFALAFAGEERLVAGDQQGTLREWGLDSGEVQHEAAGAHKGAINGLDWSGEGKFVATAGEDGEVKLWNDDLSLRSKLGSLESPATDVAVAADGEVIAAVSRSGKVAMWNEAGKLLAGPLDADDNTIWAVALSPGGDTMALAHDDEVVSLWSLSGEEPKKLRDLAAHRGGALDLVFLDETTLAVSSRRGDVRLWDVRSGLALGPALSTGDDPVWHLAAGGGGTLWAAGESGGAVSIDALSRSAGCSMAEGSLDDRQRRRLFGDEELRGCSPSA